MLYVNFKRSLSWLFLSGTSSSCLYTYPFYHCYFLSGKLGKLTANSQQVGQITFAVERRELQQLETTPSSPAFYILFFLPYGHTELFSFLQGTGFWSFDTTCEGATLKPFLTWATGRLLISVVLRSRSITTSTGDCNRIHNCPTGLWVNMEKLRWLPMSCYDFWCDLWIWQVDLKQWVCRTSMVFAVIRET